jgi:gamma-glutamyltranspeptidase/glutathione hydrolase
MLSAMSPTIVLDTAGQVLLVLGGRGGPRIISSTLQVAVNVIDHHMSLSDALAAPRIHHQAWPDTLRYEANGLSAAVVDSLRAMGHAVARGRAHGLVKAIMRAPGGGWQGAYDPRTTGGAVGY